MLLPRYVLSNTDLDDKIEQIQVMRGKEKYKNAEYDDNTVEYLGSESYERLQNFLKHSHFR
jgi:hypothetical protein